MIDPAAPLSQAEIIDALARLAEQEAHATHAMRSLACASDAGVRPRFTDMVLRQERRALAVGAAHEFLVKLWGLA